MELAACRSGVLTATFLPKRSDKRQQSGWIRQLYVWGVCGGLKISPFRTNQMVRPAGTYCPDSERRSIHYQSVMFPVKMLSIAP